MDRTFQPIRAVARVLIMNEAGELLLCRSRDGKAWVPPGGTLDSGETLAEAAMREAAEEAGLAVDLGPMVYLQEFVPAHRPERVLEMAFRARARQDHPAPERGAVPVGGTGWPWSAWTIQDLDGPVREVRWFSRESLVAEPDPVYPAYLRERFWLEGRGDIDPYLGLAKG
ncbi:MAG TPA: NUDIX hydrolase [Symbiobacteriaceae bacterium]|nr:NUDIX hydrolase [Symbiobacteriaceae bacterium]